MAGYITQMRRGTAEEWATIGKHIIPLEGELVLEIDKSGKGLHRLKIGDGINLYSNLPYISVDSFILPQPISITIYADRWQKASDNRYYQQVAVANAMITSGSKIDLQPDSEQLSIFHEKDLAFVTENEDGVVYVYCIGQVPQNDYVIQATVTEVMLDG